MNIINMTIDQLLDHYRNKDFTPSELVKHCLVKSKDNEEYNSWIKLMSMEEVQFYLDQLEGKSPDDLPLYGIPFAIKDNIDLGGIPTTAACDAFKYTPQASAFVVQRLIDAGAIPVGKTNLDQFATGLVGTRSPYGATRNAFNTDYISGGSSSGSAVVVAQGLVSFSLGTDTAGSGRVPAAFNNILGLKPSRGLLSNTGVVPACKSLDCVALFATTTQDLQTLFQLTAIHDAQDPYSRSLPKKDPLLVKAVGKSHKTVSPSFRFAVPQASQLQFFGNTQYQQQFDQTVAEVEKLGGIKEEVDFSAFLNAARLLYEGPWVTERYLACGSIIEEQPDAVLEVTRNIISPGKNMMASDAFRAQYQLQACKQLTDVILEDCDFLLTPTAGTIYKIEDVQNDPIQLNSNLGYYTNYMNLLDYASIAIPAGFTDDGLPFGITLISTTYSDNTLMAYAGLILQSLGLPLGATNKELPEEVPLLKQKEAGQDGLINIVVCGAHMSGLPLNHQLVEREATLVRQCQSAPRYKLIALPGGPPERPGMLRQQEKGHAIEIEVWQMPSENFGSFLAGIPHPLGLGKVELEDGSWETGFICESYIEPQAKDISRYGGWRKYIQA